MKGFTLDDERLKHPPGPGVPDYFDECWSAPATPDLNRELPEAIMGALDAHTAMSTQALNSKRIQAGPKDILLQHVGLWEALREPSAHGQL